MWSCKCLFKNKCFHWQLLCIWFTQQSATLKTYELAQDTPVEYNSSLGSSKTDGNRDLSIHCQNRANKALINNQVPHLHLRLHHYHGCIWFWCKVKKTCVFFFLKGENHNAMNFIHQPQDMECCCSAFTAFLDNSFFLVWNMSMDLWLCCSREGNL